MSSFGSDQCKARNEPLSTSSLQEYIYQPLPHQHIRLLRIPKDSEELHIIHTEFKSAPAYTTVSYTWNGESRDQSILIDGYIFKVINNFRIALPHLAKAAKTQYLWVDELCINQEDDEEKAVQVSLMQKIYTSCRECLVWLGESTPEAEMAIDAIPRIRQNLELHNASQVWDMEGIGISSPETLDSPLWKGFANIFSRPWFKRIWTFQEAILPPNIILLFNSKVLAFDDIVPLANPLLNHLTSLQQFYTDTDVSKSQRVWVGFLKTIRIYKFRNSSSKFQNPLDTLRMLYFTRPWSSTNPLDKIYGILGLADPSLSRTLIAQWYLEQGEDLFILNLASSLRYEDIVGLPSWIPHFGRLGSHWCIGVIWPRFRTGINKNRHKNSGTMIGQKLYIDGIRIDEVSHIIPYISREYNTQAEKCQKILKWEEECLDVSRALFPNESDGIVSEAHWTTMISAICDNHITPSRNEYDLLKLFLEAIAMAKPLSPELKARSHDFSIQIRRFFNTAGTGHFFRTTSGRIGIGSKCIQPGDQISVFYNSFTPFILRRFPGSDSEYKLISDSYNFGLMHGETFMEGTQLCKETFILV